MEHREQEERMRGEAKKVDRDRLYRALGATKAGSSAVRTVRVGRPKTAASAFSSLLQK